MAASDKARLLLRLQGLHKQGKTWKQIADDLEQEGYEEKGLPLTANALRKRYAKWSRAESSMSALESETDAALPVPASESALASSLANLVSLNNQLLEQIQQSQQMLERIEKRLEELNSTTIHTGIDRLVTSRDLLDAIKEMNAERGRQMQFIEEKRTYLTSLEDIRQFVEDSVQDRIDAELKTMLSEGGSFSKELGQLVDQRLKALFSGLEPVTRAQAGPGRGKRGKTHKKFSASLEESLFVRVRNLPGQFSGHLANALSTYLAVVEVKKEG